MSTKVFTLHSRLLSPLLFLLLAWGCSFSALPAAWYRVIEKSPERLLIEVIAPVPLVDTLNVESGSYAFLYAPAWPKLRHAQTPAVPFQTLLVDWPVQEAHLRVISSAPEERLRIAPLAARDDAPITGAANDGSPFANALEQDTSWRAETFSGPYALAEVGYAGAAGQGRLWQIRVFPYRYDRAAGELVWTASMRLEITAGGVLPLSSRLPALAGVSDLAVSAASPLLLKSAGISGSSLAADGRVKFFVEEDGWYRVTGLDLRKAGIDLLEIDISRLRLTCAGKEIPFYLGGSRDSQMHPMDTIEFYGTGLRQTEQQQSPDLYQDPFSRTNVYWLSWEGKAGLRMEEETSESVAASAQPVLKPFSFYETVHVEQDGYFEHYDDIPAADSLRDHWLYDDGIAAGSKRSYPFALYHPDARSSVPVQVRVMLTGRTFKNDDPHQAAIFLNDRFAIRGSGQRQGIIDLVSRDDYSLLAANLNSGVNSLTVVNEFNPALLDHFVLNWFEVTYPRLYRAEKGWLEFTIPPDYEPGFYQFTLDGFAEDAVEIFKLGASKIVGASVRDAMSSDGLRSMRVQFYDTVPSHQARYIAVSPSAKRTPLRIEAAPPQWQPSARDDIDWMVIAPRSFLGQQALKTLMQHRQSQGHHTAGIAVEDIFTYFNHGRRTPHAIKAFLRWAAQRWPLQYLLLAGDGSFLRTPVQGDTLDLVPVFLRQTLNYGAASSDFWYSLLEGDDEIPDIYVGRLPARTPEQLKTVVGKIIAHETNAESGPWHNRLLFIGGNGWVFREKGVALAQKAPPAWSTEKLFTTLDQTLQPDPFYGNTPQLLDFIDRGCAIINFHGHGGGAIWSDNGLLRLEDVASMRNQGRYPLILSMTCYTGAFEQPYGENLAETMLFTPDKGTMAFFGASGYGWRDNDDVLQTAIMDYLYSHPQATLGEIVTAGKIRYFSQAGGGAIARSEVSQYALFGDPAMRLRLPSSQAPVEIAEPLVSPGDSLAAIVQWPFAAGSAVTEFAALDGVPDEGTSFSVSRPETRLQLPIPALFAAEQGILRVYGVDALGLQQTHGSAFFSFGQAFFDSVRAVPGAADTVHIRVMLRCRIEPDSVFCIFRGDSLRMQPAGAGWYGITVKSYREKFPYNFLALFPGGGTALSGNFLLDPAGLIKVEALTNRLSWGGDQYPILYLPVLNWGDGAGKVVIRLELLERGETNWHPISSDTIAVTAYTGATAAFPINPAPGRLLLRFLIDAGQDTIHETRESIDATAFALEPGAGFRFPDGAGDTLRIDSRAVCIASGQAVLGKSLLKIDPLAPARLFEQPDFAVSARIPVYSVYFGRPAAVDQGVLLSCATADSDFLQGGAGAAAFFYRENATKKWVRLPTSLTGSRLTTTIRQTGLYTLLLAADDQPPHLDAGFDGRPYAANAFVNRDATFALQLRDQNGIDIAKEKLQFLLDGQTVEQAAWALPDSIVDGNLIPLNLHLHLQPGLHHLSVAASDCNGNAAAVQEYAFQVADAFHLNLLGTYPNPFARQTIFAYILSSSAERLSLKIYTAAGRLIRELDARHSEDPNPLSADYHELTWDGTDSDGIDVANGVYFYRLSARAGEKTEEKTGKIARIQ